MSGTGTLPIISETGAVNSGTIAVPRKKTDKLRISSVLEGKPRSSPMALRPGATVAEDMELSRLNIDIGTKASHFFLADQFLGLCGLSGPSNVTRFGSVGGIKGTIFPGPAVSGCFSEDDALFVMMQGRR